VGSARSIEGSTLIMEYFELLLSGDPTRAKATVEQALEQRRFRLTWTDEWTATAERGNKVANALLGAFAQYFKVHVAVRAAPEAGRSIVRIDRGSRGYMGGAIGASRTNKNLQTLFDELQATFGAAGVLEGALSA
jgi:hypothetical protein